MCRGGCSYVLLRQAPHSTQHLRKYWYCDVEMKSSLELHNVMSPLAVDRCIVDDKQSQQRSRHFRATARWLWGVIPNGRRGWSPAGDRTWRRWRPECRRWGENLKWTSQNVKGQVFCCIVQPTVLKRRFSELRCSARARVYTSQMCAPCLNVGRQDRWPVIYSVLFERLAFVHNS